MTWSTTLRLSDEQGALLELVARADDQNVTEALRSAVDAHIAARREDKDFRERLRARHKQESALYERLAR